MTGWSHKIQWQLTHLISWVLALIALVFYFGVAVNAVNFNNPLQDFHVFYSSAQYASQGQPPYGVQAVATSFFKQPISKRNPNISKRPPKNVMIHKKYKVGVNLNPPFFTMLIEPLVHIPYRHAYYFWVTLIVVFLYASVHLLLSTDKKLSCQSQYVALFFFFLLTFAPTQMNAACGQLGGFFAFFIVLSWWFGHKKNYHGMVITLAFLASIKLFVAFFAFMLLFKKQYRLLIEFVIAGLFFSFLPLLFGYHLSDYWTYILTIQNYNWVDAVGFSNWNVSLFSPFARINHFILHSYTSTAAKLIHWLYYMLTAWVVYLYATRISQLDWKKEFDYIVALTIVIMFAVCPLSWTYYLVSLMLVLYVLIKRAITMKHFSWYVLAVSCAIFLIGIYFEFLPTFKHLTGWLLVKAMIEGNIAFVGYVILIITVFHITSRSSLDAQPIYHDEKSVKFSLYSAFLIMLIPGLYAMNHSMPQIVRIFMLYH